jgi:hypothetical protein
MKYSYELRGVTARDGGYAPFIGSTLAVERTLVVALAETTDR